MPVLNTDATKHYTENMASRRGIRNAKDMM